LGQRRGEKKKSNAGREDGIFVHPQNSFTGLILKRCIGGCWFTPALNSGVGKYWIPKPHEPGETSWGGGAAGGKPIQNLSVELVDLPVKFCWV